MDRLQELVAVLVRRCIGAENSADTAPNQNASELLSRPRIGKKDIEEMMNDFLKAWLVEGDMVAAKAYISDRAFACLAEDLDDPNSFDRGMAPFMLATSLQKAHDALGKRESLEGLTIGIRLARPELRLVNQPHHAQFVIYSVPDDVAAAFECEHLHPHQHSQRPGRAGGLRGQGPWRTL